MLPLLPCGFGSLGIVNPDNGNHKADRGIFQSIDSVVAIYAMLEAIAGQLTRSCCLRRSYARSAIEKKKEHSRDEHDPRISHHVGFPTRITNR